MKRKEYLCPAIMATINIQTSPLCAGSTETILPDDEYGDYNDDTINAKTTPDCDPWDNDWYLWKNEELQITTLNSKLK